MGRAKAVASAEPKRRSRPALSPEAREKQMIALAVDCAEEQLRNGTASAQVITHYLKLGTTKERYENEKLKKELDLLTAKTEALQSQRRVEELYANALSAMKSYQPSVNVIDDNQDI